MRNVFHNPTRKRGIYRVSVAYASGYELSGLVHHPVLILGLAVLALATVVSRKPWLTPKRLIYRTHVLRLDDALASCGSLNRVSLAYASGYELSGLGPSPFDCILPSRPVSWIVPPNSFLL
ncbi:hypothetical protein Pla52n_37850 [Stieleria varia]|uniref:Uncharacterized protein n=1 Tax=Stieleria varia TaxID=2528005 RepID=A0A5C6AUJ5_9BACT|nr:hypothetical protein Pla52n_37850 [Stieleria varia]